MYAVVCFTNESTVEVVPLCWCLGDNKCLWPQASGRYDMTKIIRECKPLQDDYFELPVKILYQTVSYEKAREKLKLAEMTSDVATDHEQIESGKGKRKKRRVALTSSDELESENEVCNATKIKPKMAKKKLTNYKPVVIRSPPKFKKNQTPKTIDCAQNISTPEDNTPVYSAFMQENANSEARDSNLLRKIAKKTPAKKRSYTHFENTNSIISDKVKSTEEPQTFFGGILAENLLDDNSNIEKVCSTAHSVSFDQLIRRPTERFDKHHETTEKSDSTPSASSTNISLSLSESSNRVNKTPTEKSATTSQHDNLNSRNFSQAMQNLSDDTFKKTVISMLCDIKIKLDRRDNCTCQKSEISWEQITEAPKLPLDSLEALNLMEDQLEKNQFREAALYKISTYGAKKIAQSTRRILTHLLTHEVSLQINWSGANGKQGFKDLRLKKLVIDAVRISTNLKLVKDLDVEVIMKLWFKHSKDRAGGRMKRLSITSE